MWKRLGRAAIRNALRNGRVRRVVEAELAGRRGLSPPQPEPPEGVPGHVEFVDSRGVRHVLDPSLRDRLKPGWRTTCDPEVASRPPSNEALADRARKAKKSVGEAAALLASVAGVRLGGRILEVGCYDGSVAYELARRDGTEVVASDLARYYVVQRPGEPAAGDVEAQELALAELRERARAVAGSPTGRVAFVEDDITASALEPGSFDAIVSFEVVEHLRDPGAAFQAMARLLKPGGVAYHDYNPFFSANGGHSLCTLDFPWGHARLDAADFERYLREIRPTEAAQALRFYTENLNRLTLAALRGAVEEAGLELLTAIPWTDRALVPRLPSEVLPEVRLTYPGVGVEDLLATFVAVIARRPRPTVRRPLSIPRSVAEITGR